MSRRVLFYRLVNPAMRSMVRRGAGSQEGDLLRTLRLPGRRSGRIYEVPLRVAVIDGHRYVMTMLPDVEWARNLRAAGTAELLHRDQAEPVTARELLGEEKIRFLTTLFRDRRFAMRARATLRSVTGKRTGELDDDAIRTLGGVWHPFELTAIAV